MTSVTLLLPLPPRALSPNARTHWGERHRATKDYAELVRWHVWQQLGPRPPHFARAHLSAFYIVGRDRHPRPLDEYMARDSDNAAAAMKAGWDSLVRLGLLAGDDAEHLAVRCCLVRAEMAGGLVAVHIEGET